MHILIHETGQGDQTFYDAWEHTRPPHITRLLPDPRHMSCALDADAARVVMAWAREINGWDDNDAPLSARPLVWRERIIDGSRWWTFETWAGEHEIGVRIDGLAGPYRLDYTPSARAVELPGEGPLGDLAADIPAGVVLVFDTLAAAQLEVVQLFNR